MSIYSALFPVSGAHTFRPVCSGPSRYFHPRISSESSMIVKGPSLQRRTCMSAPKEPVRTTGTDCPAYFHNMVKQCSRLVGIAGVEEGRPIPLAAVCVQGKLRNQEKLSLHLIEGKIRLAVFIGKNPKTQHLLHHSICNFHGIPGRYTHKNQISPGQSNRLSVLPRKPPRTLPAVSKNAWFSPFLVTFTPLQHQILPSCR